MICCSRLREDLERFTIPLVTPADPPEPPLRKGGMGRIQNPPLTKGGFGGVNSRWLPARAKPIVKRLAIDIESRSATVAG